MRTPSFSLRVYRVCQGQTRGARAIGVVPPTARARDFIDSKKCALGQCVFRKLVSHVMDGRIVPLDVMRPVLACQVAPTM